MKADLVSRVIVATDDERIALAVSAHGSEVRLTSPSAPTGTDRVAEVAQSLDAELIVNVQGDEPLIEPSTIDSAIAPLIGEADTGISTTSEPITSAEDVFNPAVVKVVSDVHGYALYFSRAAIPHHRPHTTLELLREDPALLRHYRKHTGLYAYRARVLREFVKLPRSALEQIEGLEQLRALENGYRIRVVPVDHRSIGVDTLQDYETVRKILEESEQ
jgi:3-deoxy-manno-octulosonate cytidylyltransferase (CMP-KDO synthetase)